MSKPIDTPHIETEFAIQQGNSDNGETCFIVSGVATASFSVEIAANSADEAEAIFKDDALHFLRYLSDTQLHDIQVYEVL